MAAKRKFQKVSFFIELKLYKPSEIGHNLLYSVCLRFSRYLSLLFIFLKKKALITRHFPMNHLKKNEKKVMLYI